MGWFLAIAKGLVNTALRYFPTPVELVVCKGNHSPRKGWYLLWLWIFCENSASISFIKSQAGQIQVFTFASKTQHFGYHSPVSRKIAPAWLWGMGEGWEIREPGSFWNTSLDLREADNFLAVWRNLILPESPWMEWGQHQMESGYVADAWWTLRAPVHNWSSRSGIRLR